MHRLKKTALRIRENTYRKLLLLLLKRFGLEILGPCDLLRGVWGALAVVTHWNDRSRGPK